ncbi:hypothetical protein IT575_09900 [bacterium]|nr:hypothetical protein [bacterium]
MATERELQALDWAEDLARELAPEELDLAGPLLQAYLDGSDQLRPASPHGSFGAGQIVALLPFVFKGLGASGPLLAELLGSGMLLKVLETCGAALTVVELGRQAQKLMGGHSTENRQLQSLVRVAEELPKELAASGISAEEAERASLKVLRLLLRDPAGASEFLQLLERRK